MLKKIRKRRKRNICSIKI